jgi:hypothetical protein
MERQRVQGLREVIGRMSASDGDELEIVKALEGWGRADLLPVGLNNLGLCQADHRRVQAVSADIRPGCVQLLPRDGALVILEQADHDHALGSGIQTTVIVGRHWQSDLSVDVGLGQRLNHANSTRYSSGLSLPYSTSQMESCFLFPRWSCVP